MHVHIHRCRECVCMYIDAWKEAPLSVTGDDGEISGYFYFHDCFFMYCSNSL